MHAAQGSRAGIEGRAALSDPWVESACGKLMSAEGPREVPTRVEEPVRLDDERASYRGLDEDHRLDQADDDVVYERRAVGASGEGPRRIACRPMLFSVLLPTHNRLEFLRYAIETVRRQSDPDWEIVVSDNDSEEDIESYVAGLADQRLRYVRTDTFVPVTENWNNALRHSRGEYVVMLGDDDALLPGYFARIRATIEGFERPDAVYTGALLYAYPGVLPDVPEGYLKPQLTASFFADAREPFLLARDQAHDFARAAANFRVKYDFNMQYVALKRETVDDLAGDGEFFRSPFPDYYAMNLVFARAHRIVADPEPRVVVGITRRSHGYFFFNHREADARALLDSGDVEPGIRRDLASVILPGTNMNTAWLLAMESLYRRLGSPQDMRPNYARYRRLQAMYCERAYHIHRTLSRADLDKAERAQPWLERWALRVIAPIAGASLRNSPALRAKWGAVIDRVIGQSVRVANQTAPEVGRYRNIVEVFDGFERRAELSGRWP